MDELRIIRGTDVTLYADDDPLFGVTAFSASQAVKVHEVHEYLSAAPVQRVPQGAVYQINMKIMTMFASQIPDAPFTLRIADGETEYRYENCSAVSRKAEAQGNEYIVTAVTCEADRMTKRRTANDGG